MIDPKSIVWKSPKYREWIRMNKKCLTCSYNLDCEPESYQGHHHRHSGGKRPSDHLIVAICNERFGSCHKLLHANEARFNEKYKKNEKSWLCHIVLNLINYVESMNVNALWIIINALLKAAIEAERDN